MQDREQPVDPEESSPLTTAPDSDSHIRALHSVLDDYAIYSVTDRQGRIVEVNSGLCRISGYSREELLGRDHRILNSGHHPKSFWEQMWSTILAGNPWQGEVCNRAKDGQLYWVQSTNVPQLDAEGNIEGFVSLRFDITEQKRLEARSRQTQQQLDDKRSELQMILDAIPAFIYYKDDQNTILDLNRTAAESIGLPPEEIRGRKTEEFFPAEDAAGFLADDREVLGTGRPKIGIVEEYETGENERRQIHTDKMPLRGPSGTFDRLVAVAMDVTDLNRARAHIEELQQRFERATDGAHEGLWDYEPATRRVWFSHQFKRLVGIDPAQSEGFDSLDAFESILHPLDRSRTLAAIRSHLDEDRAFDERFRLQIADGAYRWFRARGRASRDGDGRATRMSGSLTDIDEQHNTETRLDLAARAARLGLWDWDVPSGQTFFSDTFYTMLGYEPGELPMCLDTWKDLVHPDDVSGAIRDIERHLAGETPTYVNEHRLRMSDGAWLWIRDIGEVVERSEDGSPKRMIGFHVDIHAIKEAGEALAEITSALDASSDSVFMFDAQSHRFVYANRRATEQVGYSAEEFRELTPVDITSHFDESSFGELLRPLHENPNVPRVFRTEHEHRDGHRVPVEISLQLVPGLGSSGRFVAVARDITEQLESDRRIEAARETAERANQAKSEFLANMSHEIRTPMTAILGYADLIESDPEFRFDPVQLAAAIGTIRGNAQHLLAIVNDILDVSKIEAQRMTVERIPVQPAEIVQEVVALLFARAEEQGSIWRLSTKKRFPSGSSRTRPASARSY